MAQRMKDDKIGSLSHAVGVISLGASVLTIGGQQYSTSTLNRTISTDVTLVANTLYMIYAVVNSGVVELRISTNVNSAGPAGFNSWKLVGAFYSNGLASVAFGSFVNIEGTPETLNSIPFTPTYTGGGTLSATNFGRYSRNGNKANFNFTVVFTGAGSAVTLELNIPFSINTSELTRAVCDIGHGWWNAMVVGGNVPSSAALFDIFNNSAGTGFIFNAYNQQTPVLGSSLQNNTEIVGIVGNLIMTNWSSTPLKDL